jgi:hypothetical protein
VESPQDAQLVPLERLVRQRLEQSQQAQNLLEHGQRLLENKSFDEALRALESAHLLDEQNVLIRAIYIQALLGKAAAIVDADLPAAERLVEAAFALDAANASVKNMRVLVSDRKRSSAIDQHLSKARELQATNELDLALAEVEKGLAAFPGDASLVRLHSSLEANKESELRKDRGKILSQKRFDASIDDSLLSSDESLMLPRKLRVNKDASTVAGEADDEVPRRQAAAIVTPPPAKVDPMQGGVPSDQTLATESGRGAERHENTVWVRPAPHNLRKLLFIALGAILIITSVAVVKWTNRPPKQEMHSIPPPPQPPPDVKSVGDAVAGSAITLLKDPVESGVKVASLNAGDLVKILEPIPPSSNNGEWILVQPVGQPANRGYVRLGDLDRVDTIDHHFNLLCALASIMESMDYADVMSRLESLQLAEPEADDIYLGLAQAYVHLTELTFADKSATRTALNKAKEYLKRAGALQSTGEAQNLVASIQLFDKRLSPPETQSPDPAKLLAQANAAFQKAMILEASSNFDNALKQYSLAKTLCERIKDLGVSNLEAEALRDKASQALVRVLLKIKPQ